MMGIRNSKPYDVLTGVEFNTKMAGKKRYKLLNYDLQHYKYNYEPNTLNSLDKTGEVFDPNPNCAPHGLYFCAESDIIKHFGIIRGGMANGLIAEAVDHATAIGDVEYVASLIEKNAITVIAIYNHQLLPLVDWLKSLPEHILHSRPRLLLMQAWALSYSGKLEPAEAAIRECSSNNPHGRCLSSLTHSGL